VGFSDAGQHFGTIARGWGSSRLFQAYCDIRRQVALGAKVECGGVHASARFKRRLLKGPYLSVGIRNLWEGSGRKFFR
jgi:hypothetical protein